jgi:hypothetical protein
MNMQSTSKTTTRKTRSTRQPAVIQKGHGRAPSQARKKSTCESVSEEPEAPLQVRNKPTRKSAQAVATLCQRLAQDDSADDLEELPDVDEYDETQESDALTTTTTTTADVTMKKVTSVTGKLAKKGKAKERLRVVEVIDNIDSDDNDESTKELEGKYIHIP